MTPIQITKKDGGISEDVCEYCDGTGVDPVHMDRCPICSNACFWLAALTPQGYYETCAGMVFDTLNEADAESEVLAEKYDYQLIIVRVDDETV